EVVAMNELDAPPPQRGDESQQAPPIEVASNHEQFRREPPPPEFVRQPPTAIAGADRAHRVPAIAQRLGELQHHLLRARGSVRLAEQRDAQRRRLPHRWVSALRGRRTSWT